MHNNIATPAALIGDPVRAAILSALIGGRAEPASVLARQAGVSPQSASNHLARLVDGGLLAVHAQGRHRYYRLASNEVAHALEALACLSEPPPAISPTMRALRQARTCYSHLAGVLGVAVTEALVRQGLLAEGADARNFDVTETGSRWFAELGIDAARAGAARRCLDCTERRAHLAGPLGVAMLARFKALGWVKGDGRSRAIALTAEGRGALASSLGLRLDAPAIAA